MSTVKIKNGIKFNAENKKKQVNIIPNNFGQIKIITKYTLLDYIRSRRFIILSSLIFGLSLLLLFITDNMINVWAQMAPIIGILSSIFFGSDAIAGEFQNKTGYYIIPNPINRSSIYLGKWLAAYLASSLVLGGYLIITLIVGLINKNIPDQFIYSIIITWFFLAAGLSVVFCLSAVSKSILTSIFLDVILLLWLNILLINIAGLIPFEPWFVLNYGGEIIGTIFMDPYPPHVIVGNNPLYPKMGGITASIYTPSLLQGFTIIGLYIIIPMITGLILFKKKEF